MAHEDSVTSLDIDPTGLHVVSAGHDRSLRVWDICSKKCVNEFSAHRRKHDEAIHSVRFHPTLPFMARFESQCLTFNSLF